MFAGGVLSLLVAGCEVAAPAEQFMEVTEQGASPGRGGGVTICSYGSTVKVSEAIAETLLAGEAYRGECRRYGDRTSLGDGTAQVYIQLEEGKPAQIGLEFTASMLEELPAQFFDGNNCWDVDGDGRLNIEQHPYECAGGHQRILFFPPEAKQTPFQWMLLNWNPDGHEPAGAYLHIPHFDFHFYMQDYLERNFIRPGPCALLINCDDFETATQPVPPRYLHPDFANVGAAEVRMGNHLVDLQAPEFQGGTFTKSWIYGSWAGRITFWDLMITLATLRERPMESCTPIKLPAAFDTAGYYPTQYCIHYSPARKEYTVSLDDFVFRSAG